jgi:hypothetical protein
MQKSLYTIIDCPGFGTSHFKRWKKKKNRGFVVEELDMSPGFLLECDSEHAGWW